jgi:hypothetical protein
MYSMSTETVETVGHFTGETVTYLPLSPGVLYEFIEEGAADTTQSLLTANQLEAGKTYSMIVSDAYGLRRYQTGDLFRCRGFITDLPHLCFVGRRNLEYSFTGEKLTADQLTAVVQKLREEYPQLGRDAFLTCVPSHPVNEPIPHYKIIMVTRHDGNFRVRADELGRRCNDFLSELNGEYRSKFESGRLGSARFILLSWDDFIRKIAGSRENGWGAQFKFLPLYRRTWESMGEAEGSPKNEIALLSAEAASSAISNLPNHRSSS